jgi:hypothetical protein
MATVSRSDQTAKLLQIALIITVALLFVLAVLCYFVFASRSDAMAQLDDAKQQLSTAQQERTQQQTAATELKRILGFPDNKPIKDINTETTQAFGTDYADFQADAGNYTALAARLLDELRRKDDDLLKAKTDLQAAEKGRQDAEQARNDAKAAADRDLQAREQQFASNEADFNQRRAAFEQQQQQLRQAQQAAQDESTAFKDVMETLAQGEKLLSSQYRERYREAASAGPTAQVRLLYEQLNDQTGEISKKNRLVAALGAASQDVQDYLLRSLPQADRVDRYDGRIVSIDEANNTVEIAVPATAGLRPGLVFRVFSGDDLTPLWSAGKGTVEVVSSRAGRVVARIRDEAMRNPIIVGDGLATPLWSPGMPMDVVIVGLVQFDDDKQDDSDDLNAVVERLGGRVAADVEASTTLLVDAGRPVSRGGDDSREPIFRPQDEKRRNEQIDQARRLGIRTVGLDVFLDWLGMDRETMQSGEAVDIPGRRLSREDASASVAP